MAKNNNGNVNPLGGIISICKKVLVVCALLFVLLIGLALCSDSDDSEETTVDTATEEVIELTEQEMYDEKVAAIANAENDKEKKEAQDDMQEFITRGRLSIVRADGEARVFSFIGGEVTDLGDGLTDVPLGIPYVVWRDDDSDKYVIISSTDNNNDMIILSSTLDEIPRGWHNYIEYELEDYIV